MDMFAMETMDFFLVFCYQFWWAFLQRFFIRKTPTSWM